MKRENDEINRLFRTSLSDAEMPVRLDFWNELEKDIPIAIRRRKMIVFRFAAAASVLLVFAGTFAAFMNFLPKNEIADAFTKAAVSCGAEGTLSQDAVKIDFPPIETATYAGSLGKKTSGNHCAVSSAENEEDAVSVTISMSFSFSQSGYTSNQSNRNIFTAGQNGKDIENEETDSQNRLLTTEVNKSRRSSINGFVAGNIPFAGKQNQSVRTEHKLPLSAGVTIRKELTRRFSLETGLVYTKLNTELTAGEYDADHYRQDQTLHYLGIPLKAGVSVYEKKRVELYASAGSMIEKCISGHIKTKHYEQGENISYEKSLLRPNPLQLSLLLSAGIQYALTDRFSIYAEPGLNYYFDDGSPVETVRKDKPLQFNLLCGIRMTY